MLSPNHECTVVANDNEDDLYYDSYYVSWGPALPEVGADVSNLKEH